MAVKGFITFDSSSPLVPNTALMVDSFAATVFGGTVQLTGRNGKGIEPNGSGQLDYTATGAGTGISSTYTGNQRVSVYAKLNNYPSSSSLILYGGSVRMGLHVNTTGGVALYDGNAAAYLTSFTADDTLIDDAQWHQVVIETTWDGSGNITFAQVYIDRVSVLTYSSSVSYLQIYVGVQGTGFGAGGIVFDDLLVTDDSADTAFASSPIPHYGMAGMYPSSDVQRGSWTAGAGGTTGLWEAINNDPPVGTATETNLTQIESADGSGNNTTDEYRIGFGLPSSHGMPTGARVVYYRAKIWHGEDVATGTKTGSLYPQANPAQAAAAQTFTFGADAGALGTWPTNWSPTTSDDSLLTTAEKNAISPSSTTVLAVRKTDTGTRVASICAASIVMIWEIPPSLVPATADRRQRRNHLIIR